MNIEYHNLYTHFVFTTLHREPIIPEKHRVRIEKFITCIVKNYNCILYSIDANPHHVHFLISRSPKIAEEYIANIIAESSHNFINNNKLSTGNFIWQDTASAFSVSKSQVGNVCKYILNQKEHHRKETFKEEYDTFITFYEETIQPFQ